MRPTTVGTYGVEQQNSVSEEIIEMKPHIDQTDDDINKNLNSLKEYFANSTKTIWDSISTTAWPSLNDSNNIQNRVVKPFIKKLT